MKKITKHLIYLTIALLVGVTSTYAIGTLTPSGTAGDDTHYSTNDIYSKLLDFTDTPTATSSPFSVPGSVEASFRTLTEIYDLLLAEEDDLVAENIRASTTIFGVEGVMVEVTPELEWSTDQGSMNWDAAVVVCADLTEGGAAAGEWRLPTAQELSSALITDATQDEQTIFTYNKPYYSSTEFNFEEDGDGAYYVIYFSGIDTDPGFKSGSRYVHCVR